jgi:hypothetical protein
VFHDLGILFIHGSDADATLTLTSKHDRPFLEEVARATSPLQKRCRRKIGCVMSDAAAPRYSRRSLPGPKGKPN